LEGKLNKAEAELRVTLKALMDATKNDDHRTAIFTAHGIWASLQVAEFDSLRFEFGVLPVGSKPDFRSLVGLLQAQLDFVQNRTAQLKAAVARHQPS
jgi:hypothetical protein